MQIKFFLSPSTLVLLSLATGLEARSMVPQIATYETVVLNTAAENIRIEATVYADQNIVVSYKDFANADVKTAKVTSKLGNVSFKVISRLSAKLAEAPLLVKNRKFICKMMPSPEVRINYLYVSNSHLLVLSPRGCWQTNEVRPINENDQAAAQELRAILKTLAVYALEQEGAF